MEKCSFCIQRIQEGRLKAKKEGRKVDDGDFKVACQQSCPSDAIVFGDLADPNSEVSKLLEHQKGYQLLEELNVRPRVSFLPKVRNPL
jgi:molybdopterin-containing oxidoreductase family iron-sulfur binding subunit